MKSPQAKRHLNFLCVATSLAPVDKGPDRFHDQDVIAVDGPLLDNPTTGVVVGYLGCTELPAVSDFLEDDGVLAVRSCLRRLWAERSICSLVLVETVASGIRLRGDTGAVLVSYPAETLAFGALCPDDDKLFGLVAVPAVAGQTSEDEEHRAKMCCHAFVIDPELYSHEAHESIAKQFNLECTRHPGSPGCLQFPPTVQRLLQLVGDGTEPKAFTSKHPHTDRDSGIGNLLEDASDRVLLVNLEGSPSRRCASWNMVNGSGCSLNEPLSTPVLQEGQKPCFFLKSEVRSDEPLGAVPSPFSSDAAWTPISEQQALSGSSACKETPWPESQSAVNHEEKRDKRPFFPESTVKELTGRKQSRCGNKKRSWFGSLGLAFPLSRRSMGLSKHLGMTWSLDDLESAPISGVGLKGGTSEPSLASSASLPNGPGLRKHHNQPVASWATGFERLLQDPDGVHCFSEFLKKEFSEENILFWQACESFSHVPESDKKQLSQKACEIYNKFLSSRATTPVNIDRQAQLADDVLNAPRPDMFQEPQLQIFNLMKFDSYARFLRSSMYQECMLAEVEGRSLSGNHHTPGSPERLSLVMPRKEAKKLNTGKVKTQDCKEEHADKKRGIFSLRNRNTSFGKGPKKSETGDSSHDVSSSNGRRESRGSLSSGASLELGSGSSFGRPESDPRTSMTTCEKEKATASCTINLPDGSRCHLPIRPGLSIRELLLRLCEKRCINLAAVDLFLAGGDKPLVLDQDSMTLSSRDLRLEKRTLFRLDLVPINRSVGLKAKPTKPVTEVLRPVVAKYGLRLSDLEARISGDGEPLDLGRPISCLDGLRVVLDVARIPAARDLPARRAPPLMARSRSTAGDEKAVNARGGNGSAARLGEKSKQKKINIEEAEEFFELLSKAQSSRADDQRGLLNKQNLVLPDFLRLSPEPMPTPAAPACSTPASRRSVLSASRQSQSLDSALLLSGHTPSSAARPLKTSSPPVKGGDALFPTSLSPIRTVEEENVADLTLVGEGDMSSPNSTLLPPPPTSPPPPPTCQEDVQRGSAERGGRAFVTSSQGVLSPRPSANRAVDVDAVRLEEAATAADDSSELNLSLEGLVAELRGRQSRMRAGVYGSSMFPPLLSTRAKDTENTASKRASRPTFV